jgi:hypothetical protein
VDVKLELHENVVDCPAVIVVGDALNELMTTGLVSTGTVAAFTVTSTNLATVIPALLLEEQTTEYSVFVVGDTIIEPLVLTEPMGMGAGVPFINNRDAR